MKSTRKTKDITGRICIRFWITIRLWNCWIDSITIRIGMIIKWLSWLIRSSIDTSIVFLGRIVISTIIRIDISIIALFSTRIAASISHERALCHRRIFETKGDIRCFWDNLQSK